MWYNGFIGTSEVVSLDVEYVTAIVISVNWFKHCHFISAIQSKSD